MRMRMVVRLALIAACAIGAGCEAELYDSQEQIDDVALAATACPAFTSSNSAHVTAGRAYTRVSGFWVFRTTTYYASGTNQSLGTSGSAQTTLYEIAAGTYSRDASACPSSVPMAGMGGSAGSAAGSGGGGSGGSTGGGTGTSGCGMAPPSSGSGKQITVNGVTRTYVLALPSGYDRSRQYPLIFAFHGLGSSGAQAQLYFGLQQAAAGQAIVVYPDAAGSNRAWGINGSSANTDLAFVDALLAQLRATLCIDDARVFAAGHSMGGYFSNTLGCARGRVIRAIAPVAGGGPYVSCDDGQVAAWIYAASDDTVVAPSNGQSSRDFWLRANHCGTTTQAVGPGACVAYDGCDAGHPVRFCLEATGGHGWPSYGGSAIWSFFSGL